MSSAATAWAWQQRVGKNKMLLLALADLADDRGCTRTPIETLAEMIDRDRSTVIRHLEQLEAEGLIERERQQTSGGIQLISRTRLVMAQATRSPETSQNAPSQIATRISPESPETPISTPSQFATRQAETSQEAGSQIATHKGKDLYSLLGVKSLTTNNTSSEPPTPDQVALQVVVGAGLQNLWQDWIRLGKLAVVTQRAQIAFWADWITQGHGELLRSEVKYVIEQGSYSHPFAGLKARMTKGIAALKAGSAAADDLKRAYGEPQCQSGERRRAPDGQVWTVDYVEYGIVFWAEAHAPLDIQDGFAAQWPLAEVVS